MNNFGDRLRKIRIERKLTQEQLGECCDTSGAVIRSIEKSRRKPSYEMLVLLCNNLNISPEYLMQDDLEFAISNEVKDDVLCFINKLTPNQLCMLKDLLYVSKKYMINNT